MREFMRCFVLLLLVKEGLGLRKEDFDTPPSTPTERKGQPPLVSKDAETPSTPTKTKGPLTLDSKDVKTPSTPTKTKQLSPVSSKDVVKKPFTSTKKRRLSLVSSKEAVKKPLTPTKMKRPSLVSSKDPETPSTPTQTEGQLPQGSKDPETPSTPTKTKGQLPLGAKDPETPSTPTKTKGQLPLGAKVEPEARKIGDLELCSRVEGIQCKDPNSYLSLHGGSEERACKPMLQAKRFGALNCPYTAISTERLVTELELPDGSLKLMRCCFCPEGSRWSHLILECVCHQSNGQHVMQPLNRKCLGNTVDEKKKKELAEKAVRAAIRRKTAKCVAHRTIDEIFPTSIPRWRDALVRQPIAEKVPVLGTLYGIVIETMDVLRVNIAMRIDETNDGDIEISLSPADESGEMIRVGVDGMTLASSEEMIRLSHDPAKKGKYAAIVGGASVRGSA